MTARSKLIGLLATGLLVTWAATLVTAQDAPPTLQEKADLLLKLDTPQQMGMVRYPETDFYQPEWLRGEIAYQLNREGAPLSIGVSREQILKVKKLVCVDTEGIPGLTLYQAIAAWQVRSGYMDDAQQTLRDAVAFSRRMKLNPPPKPVIGWCGCVDLTSIESKIACDMLRYGSSDGDVLAAVHEITSDWKSMQYGEEPYHQLAAELRRHDLSMELVRRMPSQSHRAAGFAKVAEEFLAAKDLPLAKLAYRQSLDSIPPNSKEESTRIDGSYPLRAALLLSRSGEADLARRFVEVSENFYVPKFTAPIYQRLIEQYLANQEDGLPQLERITRDDPQYQLKANRTSHECRQLAELGFAEIAAELLETLPEDEPKRYQGLFDVIGWYKVIQEDTNRELHIRLLKENSLLLNKLKPSSTLTQNEIASLTGRMSQMLVRYRELDWLANLYPPVVIERLQKDYERNRSTTFPEIPLEEAIQLAQQKRSYGSLDSVVFNWLSAARNEEELKRIIELQDEACQRRGTSPHPSNYTAGNYHASGQRALARAMWVELIDSDHYGVAGSRPRCRLPT